LRIPWRIFFGFWHLNYEKSTKSLPSRRGRGMKGRGKISSFFPPPPSPIKEEGVLGNSKYFWLDIR
jgi:hypothetical protein